MRKKESQKLKDLISSPSNFQHVTHAEQCEDLIQLKSGSGPLSSAPMSPGNEDSTIPRLPLNKKIDGMGSFSNLFNGGMKKSTLVPPHSTGGKLKRGMISSPQTVQHVHHASTEMEAAELYEKYFQEELADEATPLENIRNTLQNLFAFRSRTDRRRAFQSAMGESTLSQQEKTALKQEYLLRESVVSKKKTERMSVADFEVLKVLGHGGFGVVKLVREKATEEIMAMKCLVKQATIERGQEGHVKSERSLLSLASEFGDWIVRLHYSFQDRNFLYFVLEYMPGGDLLGLLIKKDIFPDSMAKFYFAEIVLAIEEIHKLGVIHRDIKPDNFLIDRQGHLKLADFGLATDTRGVEKTEEEIMIEPTLTTSGEKPDRRATAYSVVGTNNYVAPDVLRGQGYEKGCDWWSAGVILFEMIYGYPTFSSNTATATKKKIMNFKNYLLFPPEPPSAPMVQDIIKKLIAEPDVRLGGKVLQSPSTDHRSLLKAITMEGDASDIKAHPWFRDFNWDLFSQTPPFVPELSNKTDTANFEDIDPQQIEDMLRIKNQEEVPEKQIAAFDGFTYLAPSIIGTAMK